MKLVKLDAGGKRCERLGGAFNLGDARKEGEELAFMFCKRGTDGGGHLRFEPRGSVSARIVYL